MTACAHTIELRVLDHLIVGKEGYCSFVESRLMPGLFANPK
jgi:DNA repair protein RadC